VDESFCNNTHFCSKPYQIHTGETLANAALASSQICSIKVGKTLEALAPVPSQAAVTPVSGKSRKIFLKNPTHFSSKRSIQIFETSPNFLKDNSNLEKFKTEKGNLKVDSEGWLTYSLGRTESNKEILSQISNQISTELTPDQINKMKSVLLKHESLFGSFPTTTNLLVHRIEDSGISFSRPRRLSQIEYDQADKMVQEMLKDNIIRPSSSPYNSPIIMVTKKDGSLRFCVDFRKLNKVTKISKYPLTNPISCFEKLNKAFYFTSLDLAAVYWTIPMAEEDKEKTAFTIKSFLVYNGTFCYAFLMIS